MNVTMINESMGVRKSETDNIYVGICGTLFVGSDRYPMVVTEVISPKKIRVADMEDDYECNMKVDDNGNQYIPLTYMSKYTKVNEDKTNILPEGSVFSYRKNKRWVEEGNGLWETGGLHIGLAEEYRDPNF